MGREQLKWDHDLGGEVLALDCQWEDLHPEEELEHMFTIST